MANIQTNGCVVALDVGGTAVKSALVAGDGYVTYQTKTTLIDSQASSDVIFKALVDIIKSYTLEFNTDNTQLLGIAFGFPGPFEYEAGICRIEGLEKFDSIYGMNVRDELRSRLGVDDLPICFRNDSEAAIVGEALYGVGHTFTRLIGITLGTGLGSAFLIDGQPVTTGAGVPPNGWLYCIPFQGSQAYDVFSTQRLITVLQTEGVEAKDIKTATDLGRQGHKTVRRIFAQYGQNLATFLRPWAETFQAEAILVQGGISNAFDLFEQELSAKFPATVLKGEFGAEAALLGAAALFFQDSK